MTHEDIQACLLYARKVIGHERVESIRPVDAESGTKRESRYGIKECRIFALKYGNFVLKCIYLYIHIDNL